jgi:hypothetical protein
MGKGLANLKSLEYFVNFDEENFEEETNAVERTFRADFDGTLAIVLPHWKRLFVQTLPERKWKLLPERFADTQPYLNSIQVAFFLWLRSILFFRPWLLFRLSRWLNLGTMLH